MLTPRSQAVIVEEERIQIQKQRFPWRIRGGQAVFDERNIDRGS